MGSCQSLEKRDPYEYHCKHYPYSQRKCRYRQKSYKNYTRGGGGSRGGGGGYNGGDQVAFDWGEGGGDNSWGGGGDSGGGGGGDCGGGGGDCGGGDF